MRNFLYLLATIVIFVSCHNRSVNSNNQKVFRYNESKGIATLDPAFSRNQTTIWPACQLYNGLLQLSQNLEPVACIAREYLVSADGLVYTFLLRNDVFFHDSYVFKKTDGKGRRVIASDFVYSFKRIINPKVASPGAWIFGAVDINKADSGFEAPADTVFKIYLRYPFPPLVGILTMQYCSVIPHEAVELMGADFARHPVGTGPFMFKFWKEGEKLIFRRNPNYFEIDSAGNRLPYLDAVAITFIADKQSEFLEFIKGNIDLISGLHATFKDELVTRSGKLRHKYADNIVMITRPYLNTEYLGFIVDTNNKTVSNNPVKLRAVRQAINYGFDREKMVRFLRNNIGKPALQGFVPPGLPSFNAGLQGYNYNPDRARQLLALAGYPAGKNLPLITLMTTSDYVDLCEYIQHELELVGISINIEISTGASFREMVAQSKLPFFRGSWIADYPDAENYLALFYGRNFSPSGPNYFHFKNQLYDQLYEQALHTNNLAQRYRLYNEMDSIIISEAPVVPLFYDQVVRFIHKGTRNLEPNAMNLLVLKYTYKE